ncbi:hypothetical protein [Bacillus thuringiensis]|uniref:hypothetical protein n=1 Tax=Bacillus thuringiensis TaxID=1428 RepID=UPI0021D68CCB|nr:hypothetical protein [Bacillus thuringiensis]MCU7667566.1 hypothetical protein [Bacillus thuringiensis]
MNQLELVVSFIEMMKEVKGVRINEAENMAEIYVIEEVYYLHAIVKTGKTMYVISVEGGKLLNDSILESTDVIDFFTNRKSRLAV